MIVKGWVNIVLLEVLNYGRRPGIEDCLLYKTKVSALRFREVGKTYIGEPVFIRHEYDIVEKMTPEKILYYKSLQ